jgi:hypothetical protein
MTMYQNKPEPKFDVCRGNPAADVTPKPMPVTEMPDRAGKPPPYDLRAGIKTQPGSMAINPGASARGK